MVQYENLIKLFEGIPSVPFRKPTILEIAGYPHYENVCSNILAFFINPNNPHGLNTLVLEALLQGQVDPKSLSNIEVEREVNTGAGRIDIFIRTDSHVIGIENKIFHFLNNPLAEYSNFLKSKANGRNVIKILLSLKPTIEGEFFGFKCLTYKELIDRIRSSIGHYSHLADLKYFTLLIELLSSIENFSKGSNMDQRFIDFVNKNKEDIEKLMNDISLLKAEMRQKVQDLNLIINANGIAGKYYRESYKLFDILYYDLRVKDLHIAIDVVISPSGWEIQIFLRKGDMLELKRLLDSIDIKYRDGERFIYEITFSYTEPLMNIKLHVDKILNNLVKAG